MNSKITRAAAAAAMAFGLIGTTHAEVLYQSGAYDHLNSALINGFCSSCSGTWRVYDQFTLGAASLVGGTDVGLTASYGSNWNINVTIWSGDLSAKVYDHTYASGEYTLTPVGGNTTKASIDFTSPVSLSAGKYYISWYNPSSMAISAYSGNSLLQVADPAQSPTLNNMVARGYESGFDIRSAAPVPEPTTYAMMIAGLAALGVMRRRSSAK